MGVRSEVVGDPALLLGEGSATAADIERRLGFNLGISTQVWGGDPGLILAESVQAMRVLLDEGWSITLFPMWPRDMPYLREAQRLLGGQVDLFEDYLDIDALVAELRLCRVFVGLKLHSVVLASSVYVPSLMLEYMPKCLDFQASLDRADRNIRTDRLTAADIVDHVRDLDEHREAERAHLEARVTELRQKLKGEAQRVGTLIDQILARA
jgi:polysaccharide pyruvyl transferase WcaK-like protein